MITPGEAKMSFQWIISNTIQDSKKDLMELLRFFRICSNRYHVNFEKLEYLLDIYSLPEIEEKEIFVLESYQKYISKNDNQKEIYLSNFLKVLNYIMPNEETIELVQIFNNCKTNIKFEKKEQDEIIEKKLNKLIGLQNIKNEIKELQSLALINKKRKEQGLKCNTIAMHMVFSGSPGTGKTTVARIIGEIYYSLGIISKKEVLEVSREDLVAEYLGQSEIKTKKVLEEAKGGVLFIDEAYSLSDSEDEYGKSVINTLLKFMEDHRDNTLIIIAGYPDEMAKFIKSNPGLESRFNTFLNFENYTLEELIEILKNIMKENDYQISVQDLKLIQKEISKIDTNAKTFSNGRFVRNLFEQAIKKQASRIMKKENPTKEDLMTLIYNDFYIKD